MVGACSGIAVVSPLDPVAGTFSEHGHRDVLEVRGHAECCQHLLVGFRQQLGRGHVDAADLSQASDAGPGIENSTPGALGDQLGLAEQARPWAD